jgi:uncharacterized protein YndB with AHSA1/START domain
MPYNLDTHLYSTKNSVQKGKTTMSDYPPLHISKILNVPRQKIWDAWTIPEQFMQWYMPLPYTVPSAKFNVRGGGYINIDTQGPDGAIMPLTGTFIVVDEPAKLVMTIAPLDAAGNKLFEVQHTVVLTEVSGKTTMDITSEVLMAGKNADQFLRGMEPGLRQALDQMATLLEG